MKTMLFKLFQKECFQTGKSLIYWVYVVCVLLFFFSQMGNPEFDKLKEPVKGEEGTYGSVRSRDKDKIMEATLGELALDFCYDSWTTYPVGFAKNISLSEEEYEKIDEVLTDTTGLDEAQREKAIEDFYKNARTENGAYMIAGGFSIKPAEGLTYEQFQKEMEKVCGILGAGSSFEEEEYGQGVAVPASYEDAKKEYDILMEKDKLTGGYARLFSDYMGIILGLMPVFVAVTRSLRDRRAQMQELLYARSASSAVVIAGRYGAMVVMMVLPVFLASVYTLLQCATYARGMDISIGYFAFLPYVFGWLFPEILVVSALGMFLTELTDTAGAVLVQGIWWFADIFTAAGDISGGRYGMHLAMRHNSVMGYQVFRENFGQLARNRIIYSVAALVLLAATIWVYEKKRKGAWDFYGKIRKNRKRKCKA